MLTIAQYLEKDNKIPHYGKTRIFIHKKNLICGEKWFKIRKHVDKLNFVDNSKNHMGCNGLGSLDFMFVILISKSDYYRNSSILLCELPSCVSKYRMTIGNNFRFHSRYSIYIAFESNNKFYILNSSTREYINLPQPDKKNQIILGPTEYYIVRAKKIINKIPINYNEIFYTNVTFYIRYNRYVPDSIYRTILTDHIFYQIRIKYEINRQKKGDLISSIQYYDIDALDDTGKYNDLGSTYDDNNIVLLAKCFTNGIFYEYCYIVYNYKLHNIDAVITTNYGCNSNGIYGKPPRFYGIADGKIYYDDGKLIEYSIRKKIKRKKINVSFGENQKIYPIRDGLICYTITKYGFVYSSNIYIE